MKSTQQQVREFHGAFDLVVRDTPQLPPAVEVAFRLQLLAEEVGEFVGAMCGHDHDGGERIAGELSVMFARCLLLGAPDDADVAQVARESSDLLNVIYGTALHYGFDQDAAAAEVMAACMRRLGADGKPVKRADGKVIKPPGWVPPDVAAAIGLERSSA